MKANFKVSRYNPESDKPGAPPRWQEYKLDVHPASTILDVLIQVREEIDGTLTLRCACREEG